MIGNRIRLMRQASRLSLQQLAERLERLGYPITKAALFNYETGKNHPGEEMLTVIAMALSVSPKLFSRPEMELTLDLRDQPGGVTARRQELLAYMRVELERFICMAERVGYPCGGTLPAPSPVSLAEPDSIEQAAQDLRRYWHAGDYAIYSVCDLLEHNGWVLFSLPSSFQCDCVSGIERAHDIPFLFFAPDPYLDDCRGKLLAELGKHVLQYAPGEEEAVLRRFARAFLLPRAQTLREFGPHRTEIYGEEMDLVKQKYGLSRREILDRLLDCGIVDRKYHTAYQLRMRQANHLLREKAGLQLHTFYETPYLVAMLVSRAKAEGLIPANFDYYFDL